MYVILKRNWSDERGALLIFLLFYWKKNEDIKFSPSACSPRLLLGFFLWIEVFHRFIWSPMVGEQLAFEKGWFGAKNWELSNLYDKITKGILI